MGGQIKRMSIKKALLPIICLLLLVFPLSSCAVTGAQETTQAVTQTTTTASPASTATTSTELSYSFPLEEPVTLTYWIYLNSAAAKSITNYNEMLLFQELQKRTGVEIDFIHPAVGQEADQFSIMVASQNLPDLVYYDWASYTGGLEKASQDGLAVSLNDLLPKYSPNFNTILADRLDVSRDLTTDDGTVYFFPCIYEGDYLTVWYGPQIREDWLTRLSLKAPETIGEWHDVLVAFKNQDANGNGDASDEIPFVSKSMIANYAGYCFLGSWNIASGFYNDNGTVKYGAIQPEFKEWLTTMRQWYDEGLIDPDFAATDGTTFKNKIIGNQAGSYFGSCSGNLGSYTTALKAIDKTYKIIGLKVPGLTSAGDTNVLCGAESTVPGGGTAITKANEYPELSAQWLDYLYGEEGNILVNYGVEGVTYYTMADGSIYYTANLTNNPDGFSLGDALSAQTLVTVGGPFMENNRFWELMLVYPEQTAALDNWSAAANSTQMPAISVSADDSQTQSNILTEVQTYVSEYVTGVIMGQESIDSFDDFVTTIQGMNIDEAISIEQEALGRYLAK